MNNNTSTDKCSDARQRSGATNDEAAKSASHIAYIVFLAAASLTMDFSRSAEVRPS